MTPQSKRKLRSLCDQVIRGSDSSQMPEVLMALDRMVVEVSMRLYNVDQRDRFAMRMQNRRLHAAVRKQLPRLFKRSRRKV